MLAKKIKHVAQSDISGDNYINQKMKPAVLFIVVVIVYISVALRDCNLVK